MTGALAQLAQLAADEFRARQRQAQRQVDARAWTADTATERLLPWFAAACALGADLPELRPLLAGFTHISGEPLTDAAKRAIVADSLCPAATRARAVAQACAAALAREAGKPAADHAKTTQRIVALCAGLGIIPAAPGEVRKEAA